MRTTSSTSSLPPCRACATQPRMASAEGSESPATAYWTSITGAAPPAASSGFAGVGPVIGLVRRYDPLHQRMPHHVMRGKKGEADTALLPQHVDDLAQAGLGVLGQIDLGDVARHHGRRTEADARQKHLHLLHRGVLRLVENDE